jgi:hypothetical protein
MLRARIQQFVDTLRDGFGYGFTVGLVILFLILIGLPVKIQNLSLISILLVMLVFGIQLARKLAEHSLAHVIRNTLSMGITAAVMVFLFMSLINYWQAEGTDVSKYFDAINEDTMQVLSGVPAEELHANPTRDIFTGEYPEGAELRTNHAPDVRSRYEPTTLWAYGSDHRRFLRFHARFDRRWSIGSAHHMDSHNGGYCPPLDRSG